MNEPTLRRDDYIVRACPLRDGQRLVAQHHYAKGGARTATFMHGLYRCGDFRPLGVAWWIPPTRTCAESVNPENWTGVLSLSRLVVLPEVPKNGASFLLGRSMDLIRRQGGWSDLVTYADEFMGHTGAIYRATNWQYLGLTAAEPRWEDGDGRQVARKAGGRTRTKGQMEELGYAMTGRYRKHKFVMRLKPCRNAKPTRAAFGQESLFA